jgi:PAS domain-containing protein
MQEQYLRALESEDVPVGIVILEGEKRLITFVNPALSKLWGRTKEQILNRPLFEAIPELVEPG